MGVSKYLVGIHPPEGPPVWAALNVLCCLIPPPISKIIFRSVVPMGTSTSPTLLTLPAKANTFVPLLFSVPTAENHSAPFKIIGGMLANVSTLLTHVGLPHSPFWAGNGGLTVGSPRVPSMEWIRAVSSPQTNAPAPYFS